MNPQQGTNLESAAYTRSLPPEVIVLILFFSVLVIGVFVFAMSTFLRAGKSDAQTRRRRGSAAKDPLDPNLPDENIE